MSPRGEHPNSKANLVELPVVHGAFSVTVQATGIPIKKHCPLCAYCDGCDAGEKDLCPLLVKWSAETQVDLQRRGASPESAEQITRLLGILRQGYAYLAREGFVKVDKGIVTPQPVCRHLGVYENALSRALRDCGLHRALPGDESPLTPEALARMHREAREAEVEEGGDDE